MLSTYENSADNLPQGNMSGHGISVGTSNKFTKKFTEHGHVMGIMSIVPKTAYQQGIHKSFQRMDKFDYFWPEFAHIGEQEVKLSELYVGDDIIDPNETFGYQDRFSELKYGVSTVAGDFRDNMAYAHLGRIFTAKPVLNNSFVKIGVDKRIFNVTDETVHNYYVQVFNRVNAIRPLPYFSTPQL